MIYPEGTTPLVSDSTVRWLNKIVAVGGGTAGGGGGDAIITEDGSPLTTEAGDAFIT
jgi:hypothetical protein